MTDSAMGTSHDQLLPVNMSAAALVAETSRTVGSGPDTHVPQAPSDPADLRVWVQESYQLSGSLALKLGFPVASVETDNKLRIMLFGVTRYVDETADEHTYRFGVAIRVLLEIYSTQDSIQLTLPAIAAQAELGAVMASAQLLVQGYVGDLSGSLPSWQSFDVNSYADYLNTISVLQKTVLQDTTNIRPVLLSSTRAAHLKEPGEQGSTRHMSFAHRINNIRQHWLSGT